MTTTYVKQSDKLSEVFENVLESDILIFEKGVWHLDKGLIIEKSITILGAKNRQSRLIFNNMPIAISKNGSGCLNISSIEIYLSSANESSALIEVTEGKFRANNCTFTGNPSDEKPEGWFAVSYKNGLRFIANSKAEFHNCLIENFPGMALDIRQDANVKIVDSTFYNNGYGTSFTDSSKGVCLRNTYANNDLGIGIHGQSLVEVHINVCQENKNSGISVSSCGASITKNICISNGTGISVSGKSKAIIDSNDCSKNTSNGINYYSHSSGICKNNYCCKNAENGIHVDDDAYPNLIGNECSDNGDSGMRFMDHSRAIMSNNKCHRNRVFGMYKAGRAQANWGSNDCEENGRDNYMYASPTWYDDSAR